MGSHQACCGWCFAHRHNWSEKDDGCFACKTDFYHRVVRNSHRVPEVQSSTVCTYIHLCTLILHIRALYLAVCGEPQLSVVICTRGSFLCPSFWNSLTM